jgi:nicotinate-nucleotide pyrophosphorylase (carboxylating)
LDPQTLIREALAEDLPGGNDFTSDLFVSETAYGEGWIEAREQAVLSGIEIAASVFNEVDPELRVEILKQNGNQVANLERVLTVSGSARSILRAERTALNFLTHLSGIATRTRQFVDATREWGTEILCTRKTLPGLRDLQVEAVRHGGGNAYRTNLADAVLVKDNHLRVAGGLAGIRARLDELKRGDPTLHRSILLDGKLEVTSADEIEDAVTMGWTHLLLDNFSPTQATEAAQKWGKQIYLEISGGVNQTNLEEYARTRVHAISIGALTHSVKATDFSLECDWRRT